MKRHYNCLWYIKENAGLLNATFITCLNFEKQNILHWHLINSELKHGQIDLIQMSALQKNGHILFLFCYMMFSQDLKGCDTTYSKKRVNQLRLICVKIGLCSSYLYCLLVSLTFIDFYLPDLFFGLPVSCFIKHNLVCYFSYLIMAHHSFFS